MLDLPRDGAGGAQRRGWIDQRLRQELERLPAALRRELLALVPNPSKLERWYIADKKYRDRMRAEIDQIAASVDVFSALPQAKQRALQQRRSETLLSHLARVDARVPSDHLLKNNAATATGRGPARQASADDTSGTAAAAAAAASAAAAAMKPVYVNSSKQRTSEFATETVKWQQQNKLRPDRASAAVSARD